jgi:hypothetical protein
MTKHPRSASRRSAATRLTCAAVLAGLCLAAAGADAAEAPAAAPDDSGFSYFLGLARQSMRYRETGTIAPFKSSVEVAGPLLVTGALFAVNANLLVSLDSEITFYPGQATETWTATDTLFNGRTLSSTLLQTNGFGLTQTRTQLLGHYRAAGPWFGLGGAAFRTQSSQRYSFVVGPDAGDVIEIPSGTTIEESTSEIIAMLGVSLESEQVRGQSNHFGVRALVGVPIWRRLRNTSFPGTTFTSHQGVDFVLEGRYSWALSRNLHLGTWGQWTVVQRGQQRLGSSLEMPRSRLDSLGYGLELLWKL